VRRNELDGSASRSASPAREAPDDVKEALQARLRSVIELDFVDVAIPAPAADAKIPAPGAEIVEDETFAFKLFATAPGLEASDAHSTSTPGPADAADATTKLHNKPEANGVQYISLKDEPIDYPLPTRQLSYYIAAPTSALEAARYDSSAVSTADVFRVSKVPRPGLACPWRIIATPAVHARSLRASADQLHASSSMDASTTDRHRKRLGKKARIKLRNVLAKRKEEEKEKLAASVAKEAQMKEKKTRMNRAKQLRKREKAKMKGEGGAGDEGKG